MHGAIRNVPVGHRPHGSILHCAQADVHRAPLPLQVVPPWTLPVQAMGNTCLHVTPEFAPKVVLSAPSITCPPTEVRAPSYQTFMLTNHGDTPAQFQIVEPSLQPYFQATPMTGIIPAKQSQVIAVRFASDSVGAFSARATLLLNNSSLNALELSLNGSSHEAALTMDLKGPLAFRPTCIGANSTRTVTLHNPSRVPSSFCVVLSPKIADVVSVAPRSGTLRGGESTTLTWTFTPTGKAKHEAKAAIMMLAPTQLRRMGKRADSARYESFAPDNFKLVLKVAAEGTSGEWQ